MKTKVFLSVTFMGVFLYMSMLPAFSDDLKPIQLMQLQFDSGRPLMHVLKERKSSRAFSPKKLPNRVLSNLLWAANGINRPGSGGRTAPSAMNQQEIDLYVATADGLYFFDVKARQLKPILKGISGPRRVSRPMSGRRRSILFMWRITRKWSGRRLRIGFLCVG